MTVTVRRAQLQQTLKRLAAEARSPDDHHQLDAVRDQLRQDRFRVLVAGEAKRGKSTLLNALLGRDVLPTGAVPVTALATTVRDDGHEGVTVRFTDGRIEQHPSQSLPGFVTQAANPDNRLGLAEVVLHLHAPLLAAGVELVDSPGTGSVHGQNTDEARAALRTMDAAVFVLTADPPISAAERDLLAQVASASVHTFVVLNKADLISPGDLPEVIAFVEKVVSEVLGEPVPVLVCAARPDLRRGVDELMAVLAGYLADHRDEDLLTSLTRRARQVATGLLDDVLLGRAMADLDETRRNEYTTTLRTQLDTLDERRTEAVDLLRAQNRRILQEVNAAAEANSLPLARQVLRRWASVWEQRSAEWSGRDREAEGRRQLVTLTRTAVDSWRREQETLLTDRLTRLDARLRERLGHDLDTLRESVADLLGVGLTLDSGGGPLAANPRFRYQFAEDIGQTELLAGWTRRHLPAALGLKRSRAHLEEEALELVPMQVGGVRADLQQRLAESSRQMERAVAARYEAVAGRLRAVLEETDRPAATGGPTASATLTARETLLREILAELDAADTAPAGSDGAAS